MSYVAENVKCLQTHFGLYNKTDFISTCAVHLQDRAAEATERDRQEKEMRVKQIFSCEHTVQNTPAQKSHFKAHLLEVNNMYITMWTFRTCELTCIASPRLPG